MRFALLVAAAILAYTHCSARAVPNPPRAQVANISLDRLASQSDGPGPMPVTVTSPGLLVPPHGLKVPASGLEPSPLAGGILEDFPLIGESAPQDEASPKHLHPRDAMWKPDEIQEYRDGVEIDIKNSILELKDKLDYLNKGGRLTSDEATQQINFLAKVIDNRLKINFMGYAVGGEMLSALQKHIISEIELRGNDHTDTPLSPEEQAEQDSMFAALHAHYILGGLGEKLILDLRHLGKFTKNIFGKSHTLSRHQVKLFKRLAGRDIGQARSMTQSTPNLSKSDLDLYEQQLKRFEAAVGFLIKNKKKLTKFPESLVPMVKNPMKSHFMLPGEDNSSTQPDSQTGNSGESPTNPGVNTQVNNSTNRTEGSVDSPHLSNTSLPMEKRHIFAEAPYQNVTQPMPKPESRSARSSRPTAFQEEFQDILPWGTLNKRDTDSAESVDVTTTPAAVHEEEGGFTFWIDFGAPECMHFILDEDLDEAKMAMFHACEENAAGATPETSETPETPETPDTTDSPETAKTSDSSDPAPSMVAERAV